jgi:anti-anti-sigma regulatory factor
MDNREPKDKRSDRVLELITKLASGDLEARLAPSDRGDETDLIIAGLNMLAEELSASIAAERKMKDALEQRVRERTSELEQKVETIAAQSSTILELSTPVIGIWNRIVILPLIGTVDTRRAQQIVKNLLESIVEKQAAVAIIDITGVPVVDTKVADHFLKTIEAAKMLGTEVILTGVSPHNAQTLVKLGIDLSRITTKGTLQQGLSSAFELTDQQVTSSHALLPRRTT